MHYNSQNDASEMLGPDLSSESATSSINVTCSSSAEPDSASLQRAYTL